MENLMQTPIEWNDYFLEIARTVSKRSNCLRAQVGAVIVGADKKIKATGYNGTPSKVVSCMELGYCYRMQNNIPSGTRYETCRSIHAEQNAIIQAGQDRCMGSSMYIWGHNFICILCKRFIVQAGIETIYLKKDENSPIEVVTAQQLRDELSNDALKTLV
ncbi:MAG: dCMP deaminase family protein [Candidatus Gastranaerophilales bacterium]|nr:dCMP deaminase family protein [Candidatus Gastranaerophilales bacterium]